MKKEKTISIAALAIGVCFALSCSNDEYSDNNAFIETQVEMLKQKYLYYANQYGLKTIGFDEKLLKQHLNMTDEQIEASTIRLAFASGVLNKNIGTVRKKIRTRSVGENEGDITYTFLKAEGDFNDSFLVDTLFFNCTIHLYLEHPGAFTGRVKSCSVTKRYYCNDANCKILHQGGSLDSVAADFSLFPLNTDWSGGEGEYLVTDVPYSFSASEHDNPEFDFSVQNQRTYHSFRALIKEQ